MCICSSLFIAREAEERKENGRAFSEGSFAAIFASKKTGRVQYRYEYCVTSKLLWYVLVCRTMHMYVVPTVLMFSVPLLLPGEVMINFYSPFSASSAA